MTNIVAPSDWGKVKSNTHYGWIGDCHILPIMTNLKYIKFKGRWRLIQRDENGDTYVSSRYETQFFEIKKFTKPE